MKFLNIRNWKIITLINVNFINTRNLQKTLPVPKHEIETQFEKGNIYKIVDKFIMS